MQKYNIKDAIFAAALAWTDVKEDTLKKSWHKLWPDVMPKNAENAEVPSIVQNHSELMTAIADLQPDNPIAHLTEEEIVEWVEADKDESIEEVLTHKAISVLNPMLLKETDSDEEVEQVNPITWKQATDALNTFITFTENNSSFNDAEIMNLHILRNEFYKKRATSKKQTDLHGLFKKAATPNKIQQTPLCTSVVDLMPSCSADLSSVIFNAMPSSSSVCHLVSMNQLILFLMLHCLSLMRT